MTALLAQRPRADRSFERLYRRHAGDVFRYALAVLHNQSDAEDVTQTTFMNAYRAIERGEKPQNAHNWLIAIAHNVCRQRFRQSARRPSEVAWNEDVAEPLVEDDEAPTGEDIRRALSHLAFNQRAALVMRELEGRSYAEIAEVLELSVSAVETLIFRARRALREQLEGALTCGEAELAISKQLDRRLSRAEKGQLRAHLRECPECATFARRQRAQRKALRSLGAVPLPTSLLSLFGGGGTAAGVAVAGKAAAVVAAAALAGGAGYESYHQLAAPGGAPKAPAAPVGEHAPAPGAAPATAQAPGSAGEAARSGGTVRAQLPQQRGRKLGHAVRPGRTRVGLALGIRKQKLRAEQRAHTQAVSPGQVKHHATHGRAKSKSRPKSARRPVQTRSVKPPPAQARTTGKPERPVDAAKPQNQSPPESRGNGWAKKDDVAAPAEVPDVTVPPAVAVQDLPVDPGDLPAGKKSGKSPRKFSAGPVSP